MSNAQHNYRPHSEPILITEHNWPDGTLPIVATGTLTYNHEPYIRECIEGILMQKTTFPVRICIFEDCSTDNTVHILKEYVHKYPNLFYIFSQTENTYGKPFRRERARPYLDARNEAKYIALCEGDDYWIDPLKLQKQVDFLESNIDTSMVYTDSMYFYQNRDKLVEKRTQQIKGIDDLLVRNQIWTLTTCIRKSVMDEYRTYYFEEFRRFPFGDYPIWLFAATKGKLKHLADITSVYRVLDESASHSKDPKNLYKIAESVYDCKIKFIKLFKREEDSELIENKIKGVKVFSQLNIALKSNNKELYKLIIDDLNYIKYYNKKYYYFFSLVKLNFYFFSNCYNFLLEMRKSTEKRRG